MRGVGTSLLNTVLLFLLHICVVGVKLCLEMTMYCA
jgi:hypothetical protein